MPRVCDICKKGNLVGRNVSHANNRTRKVSFPNLQNAKVMIEGNVRRVRVCTRCLRTLSIAK